MSIQLKFRNHPIISFLASIKITVVCLILLFILTLWGTVSQVDIGLFQSQEKFFNSWFFLANGFFPFPGARLVIWILFINLFCASTFRFVWTWKHLGLWITHLGLLMYFVSAFVIFHGTTESNVSLFEGEGTNVSTSYHQWELAFWQITGDQQRKVIAFDVDDFKSGYQFEDASLGIDAEIKTFYRNAKVYHSSSLRGEIDEAIHDNQQPGSPRFVRDDGIKGLKEEPIDKEPEQNLPGLSIDLNGENYLLYGGDVRPKSIRLNDEDWYVQIRRKRYLMPITITLDDFKAEFHPGTEMAKSFESFVQVKHKDVNRKSHIYMNHPLRFKNWTFFQASYSITEDGREMSTFATVKNIGRWLPYITSIITFIGLLIHFVMMGMRGRIKKSTACWLVLFGLFFISPAVADDVAPDGRPLKAVEVSDLSNWAVVPILDDGRIKPIDTYAQNVLLQLSGRKSYDEKPAIYWLTRLLFAPENAKNDDVFLINHPDVLDALEIKLDEKKKRFSFSFLEDHLGTLGILARDAFQIPGEERDVVENEILRLFQNLQLFSRLSLSFSFAFPHPDFTFESFGLRKSMGLETNQANQYSFLDLYLNADVLYEELAPLESLPQTQWSQRQRNAAELVQKMIAWTSVYTESPLKILPTDEEIWKSPWESLATPQNPDYIRNELRSLKKMIYAYWHGNQDEFDFAVSDFEQSIFYRSGNMDQSVRLKAEKNFNRLKPFQKSLVFYILAFVLTLFGLIYYNKWLWRGVLVILCAGIFIQTYGIGMRMFILQRPPVTNLYETFIFVGYISAIIGVLIEFMNKRWLGSIIASVLGIAFLMIANKFSLEGDTLQMLVAVLDSNFWLATHVLTITIGYAGVCVAGIVGHVDLVQRIVKPKETMLHHRTQKILIGTLGFGLIATFLGTNLGGIWADQSWGRFWGWDPKENGALMIVLWLAILFHAKIARLIGPIGLSVGSILGLIVVMWAWFGVNLLSVGLHSYGFTSGLAWNLGSYCVVQTITASVLGVLAFKKK